MNDKRDEKNDRYDGNNNNTKPISSRDSGSSHHQSSSGSSGYQRDNQSGNNSLRGALGGNSANVSSGTQVRDVGSSQ